MKILIGTILTLFLAFQALKAGSAWDSHAYPIHNATVGVSGSDPIEGTMSRNWDGSVEVTTDDGRVVTVPSHSIAAIVYTPSKDDRLQWRFWMPGLLIIMLYIVFIGASLRKDLTSLSQSN